MSAAGKLHFGEFVYDLRQRLLLQDGRVVALSPKVLRTLELLLEAEGGVVSKETFMHALWPDTFVEESNLTQNIFILRKTLGATASGEHYLATISKRGYRLTVPVVPVPEPAIEPSPEPKANLPGHAVLWPPVARDDSLPEPQTMVSSSRSRAIRPWLVAALLLSFLWIGLAFRAHEKKASALQISQTRRLTNDGMPKNLGPFPASLVTDGERLYFTERRDNRSVLGEVPVAGGEVSTRPAPSPEASVADYFRGSRSLLLGSTWHTDDNRPILELRYGEAHARQIGELFGHEASWSPAGDRIAVARGRFLQVADADGKNPGTLVAASGIIFWPRWSRDGKRLRFSENFTGNRSEIWEVGADGKGLHQILSGTAEAEQACCGTWSADGQSYVYLVVAPARSSIWTLPEQSGIPVRLTVGPMRSGVLPWSAPTDGGSGPSPPAARRAVAGKPRHAGAAAVPAGPLRGRGRVLSRPRVDRLHLVPERDAVA